MKKSWIAILSLALAIVIATGTVIGVSAQSKSTMNEAATVCASPFTDAVSKVHDSVVGVNIYVKQSSRNNYGYGNNGYGNYGYGNDDFWNYFFGGNGNGYGGNRWYGYGNDNDDGIYDGSNQSKEVLYGYGSGVCVAKDYVLTNYHVVDEASTVKVAVGEEQEYEATVVQYDEATDIAVLYVKDLPVEPVVVGDSDTLQLGDWAICIGNPLGFYGTTTVGIISGLDREVNSSSTDAYGKKVTNSSIQTDAAINSGNSGGGLFNTAGELVGVPYLKYTSTSSGTDVEGVGMVIPINDCKDLINKALNGETNASADGQNENSEDAEQNGSKGISSANTPRIGVTISNLNSSNYAVSNGLVPNGAYISSVEEGSPAEKAGLQEGDIVVEVDGNIISNSTQMKSAISGKQVGETVQIKIYRVEGGLQNVEDFTDIPDGEYIDVEVELANLDDVAQ